ncbi:MAG: hypothetical protein E7665_04610 [Ruminococcaceae bacterium]|nr:hypothetical protein [Oscillospiraceae bacterium]
MKKIFLILVSVILVFSCVSCKREELPYLTEPVKIGDNFSEVYTYAPNDDSLMNVTFPESFIHNLGLAYYEDELYLESHDMVYKINLETGKLTTLCKDPICNHRTKECPFFDLYSYFYIFDNNVIYYRDNTVVEKNNITSNLTIAFYDIKKSKFYTLYEFSSKQNTFSYNMTLYNDELMFTDIIRDEKTNERTHTLYALNVKTRKKRVLYKGVPRYSAITADENGVYYSDRVSGKHLYAKDNDLKKAVELPYSLGFTINGKIIHKTDHTTLSSTLASYDLKTNESKDLGLGEVETYFVTDKYIYFRPTGEIDIGKLKTQSGPDRVYIDPLIDNFNSIYRCNHDGSNVEEVIKFYDGDVQTGESVYYISGIFVLDGYLYSPYFKYTKQEDGYFTNKDEDPDNDKYLRINIETGERYIIKTPRMF